MAEFRDSEKAVRQCLKDCGCDERTAEQFLAYGQEARRRDQIRHLNRRRRSLMDDLHENQKKVDCIDFMIRELERKRSERDEN